MAYGGYPYQQSMGGYYTPGYGMGMQPSSLQQNAMQQGFAPKANVNWVYVNGVSGAREQIVQPGDTAWMMDNNEPVFYVKSVDQMGSATLKCFRFEEITGKANVPEAALYASAGEMSEMAARLERLEGEYAEIVNALKGGVKNEPVGADHGKTNGK